MAITDYVFGQETISIGTPSIGPNARWNAGGTALVDPVSGVDVPLGSDLVADTTPQLGGALDLNGFTITGSGGTVTTSTPLLDLTQTWNNVAVAFIGNQRDYTDTTSATESYLDLQKVGGARKYGLRKDGSIHLWNTYTDDSNYERWYARWGSNILQIGTEAAGTGSSRAMLLAAAGVLYFQAGSSQGNLDTTGTFTLPKEIQLAEQTAPSSPAANNVRIYAVDNGAGKTQLMALFATGAAQQIAIEP